MCLIGSRFFSFFFFLFFFFSSSSSSSSLSLSLSVRGKSLNRMERAMQLCINSVQDWVTENGAKFCASKTVCIHFHQQYGFPKF